MKNRNHVSKKTRRASRKNYTNGFAIPGMDMAHGRGHHVRDMGFVQRMLKALGFGTGFMG